MTRVAKGKSIALHDAQAVKRFALELRLVSRLESDGHSHDCAKFQVFENRVCTCKRKP